MNITEAIEWCHENQAVVSFLFVYGTRRVKVRSPGYPYQERYTFEDAVDAAKVHQNLARAAKTQE